MSKVYICSQAGIKDDALDLEWSLSNQQEWFVPCGKCGQYFQADISGRREDGTLWGLRWDDNVHTRDAERRWVVPELLKTLRYECPKCGHEHRDEYGTKSGWNSNGRYVSQNSNALASNAGFHFSAIIFRSWKTLAEELANALNSLKMGVLDPLMEFTKKRDAKPWSDGMLAQTRKTVTYQVTTTWDEEKARICSVDCQMEGVKWVLICAWAQGKARRLWYGKLYGEAEIVDKCKEFNVQPYQVVIDSRYETKIVYQMCVRQGWRALRGMDRDEFVHHVKVNGQMRSVARSYSEPARGDPEIGKVYQGRRFAVVMKWSNPTIKNRLQGMLDKHQIEEPALDPKDPNEVEYKKQMSGQWKRLIRDQVTGKARWEWHGNKNDHARDCWCEQVVGATILKLLPDEEPEKELVPVVEISG